MLADRLKIGRALLLFRMPSQFLPLDIFFGFADTGFLLTDEMKCLHSKLINAGLDTESQNVLSRDTLTHKFEQCAHTVLVVREKKGRGRHQQTKHTTITSVQQTMF